MFAFKTKCLLFRSSGNLAMTLFAYLPQKSVIVQVDHRLDFSLTRIDLTPKRPTFDHDMVAGGWNPIRAWTKTFQKASLCILWSRFISTRASVASKVIIRPHGGWVKCSHVSALSKTLHQKMLPCTRKVCSQVHLSWWADPPWVPCTRLNQVQTATTAIFYSLPLPSGRWCPKHSCNL